MCIRDRESETGKGSTFHVYLPLPQAPNTDKKNKREEGIKNFILIDDDRIQLQLTAAMLKRPTIHVTCCEQPEELFRQLEENKFDALLTDIQMPAMNGFDLLDAIRALPAVRAKTIPVIAITARSDMDAEYFRSKGFAGCLHKPFNTHEIFEVLSQAIRQDLTDLEETGTEILQAPTNDSSHTDSSSLDFSALTAFSEDDPNAAKEIIRTFVSETKKNRSCMATALENEEIEGITAMAHKLLPLFTMLGANTSIAPLTWLEQKRGTTEMTSEIREKALFILDEIDRVIRQAEEQI